MSNAFIAIVTTLATLAAFVVAGFVLVRMARKRGVRIRDLLGPGGP
jgi:hypothetical protein